MRKRNVFYFVFLLPSLLGVTFFYIIPFLFSFYYAITDNMGSLRFVGLRNFADTLGNSLFQQATVNTLTFMAVSIPLGMVLALLIALSLQRLHSGRALAALAMCLPLVVPSGTIVYFWKAMVGENGLIRELLLWMGVSHEWVAQSNWGMGILTVVFLWKNVGYNVILFWSGLNWIPKTYYEQMALEGAGIWWQFRHVTWTYLLPTTFVVLLMSIVNSFKVFKEIYMLYGPYPDSDIYMLQHYMNNQFQALNLQKLTSAAYILFVAISATLLVVFYVQKRLTSTYE